ncbi:MAG: Glutathione S-transferase domain protein [Myxococcales bacterium]|nr:Glutathione S-transferase domain protein [Myxococcales bacterium]
MKLELVSHPLCPFVHRIAIMLREKGIEFSLRYVDLDAKPDWFLKISPRGKVPVLIADGTPLFESSAINEFLDETHPPRLLPENPFERAIQRAWVEVANDLLMAQYRVLIAATGEAFESARKEVATSLERLEDGIARDQIATTTMGLVQIAIAPALYRFIVLGDHFGIPFTAATPRVDAWARELVKRPSVAGTIPVDFVERYVAMLAKRGSQLAKAA